MFGAIAALHNNSRRYFSDEQVFIEAVSILKKGLLYKNNIRNYADGVLVSYD